MVNATEHFTFTDEADSLCARRHLFSIISLMIPSSNQHLSRPLPLLVRRPILLRLGLRLGEAMCLPELKVRKMGLLLPNLGDVAAVSRLKRAGFLGVKSII